MFPRKLITVIVRDLVNNFTNRAYIYQYIAVLAQANSYAFLIKYPPKILLYRFLD